MPCPPRVFLPDMSLHVIQRGNNRVAIFRDSTDYEVFLTLLKRAAERNRVAVHAYALMTNHVHLIATPEGPESLPRTMQSLGVRQNPVRAGMVGTPADYRWSSYAAHAFGNCQRGALLIPYTRL